ncbi:MAG: hypothetical protein RLZZ32_1817, partial [Cyanobacteriota bacterium]
MVEAAQEAVQSWGLTIHRAHDHVDR